MSDPTKSSDEYVEIVDWSRYFNPQSPKVSANPEWRPSWIKLPMLILATDDYQELSLAERGLFLSLLQARTETGSNPKRVRVESGASIRAPKTKHLVSQLERLNHAGLIRFVLDAKSSERAQTGGDKKEELEKVAGTNETGLDMPTGDGISDQPAPKEASEKPKAFTF